MSTIITCYTLFDIIPTKLVNRYRPEEGQDRKEWLRNRNAQCNFDTILQVISIRSQPEVIEEPTKIKIRFDNSTNFGFLFDREEDMEYPCWKFTFSIQHPTVFDDGIDELGYLYNDCDHVPMLLCGTELNKLPTFLDCSPELRNIYFTAQYDQ